MSRAGAAENFLHAGRVDVPRSLYRSMGKELRRCPAARGYGGLALRSGLEKLARGQWERRFPGAGREQR